MTTGLIPLTVRGVVLRFLLLVVFRTRGGELKVIEIGSHVSISHLHETGHAGCGRHFVTAMM
jgi:hypothetical protein